MTYQPQFINRQRLFATVNYDIVLVDDAGLLPSIRRPVKIRLANDTAPGRVALAAAIITAVKAEIQDRIHKAQIQAFLDNDDAIATLRQQIDNAQQALVELIAAKTQAAEAFLGGN